VLLALVLLAPGALLSQEVLTNDSIIKLVKSGIGEQIIVSMIRSQPGNYTTGADAIVALAKAGVSDKIIAEMIAKKSGSAPTPAPTAAPPVAADASAASGVPTFTEIGVYYKKDNQWAELLPEVVNWKTGGTIKNIASVGVVKKDVNGNISDPHSRNSVKLPLEVMIFAPEGVAITEYQLLRLRPKEDYREFRTITGGVFNQRSGAMRDMVPFEGKKVAPRMYSVIVPANRGAADYGFIHLGSSGGSGGLSSLSMGKMFTFRVIE